MVLWWFGKSAIRTRKERDGILMFMPTSVKEVQIHTIKIMLAQTLMHLINVIVKF